MITNLNYINFFELDKNSFYLIEPLLINSGLINDTFLNENNINSLEKINKNFIRNKLKIFVLKNNEKQIICFSIVVFDTVLDKIKYNLQIAYLFVDTNYRNKGIGFNAIIFIINYFSKTNAKELILYTTLDNFFAIKLYRKIGFNENNYLANYLCFKLNIQNYIKKNQLQ